MGTKVTNTINSDSSGIVGNTGTGFTNNSVTQYNLLVGGATNNTVNNIAPSSSVGTILQSQGASSNPAYSTATYPSTSGTKYNSLVSDGTNFVNKPTFNGVFGDGSDGSQTFDGTSVVLGITPSSNIYTLARDIFLSSGTINNGVSIKTNGFRIFCTGELTNNGTIQWNGIDATSATGAVALTNGNSSLNSTITLAKGSNGGTTTGTAGTNVTGLMCYGGVSGAGGNGSSGSGGAAGTKGAVTAAGYSQLNSLPWIILGKVSNNLSNLYDARGGAGGGGGGGDGTNSGGGGGGGASTVLICSCVIKGTGTIQAKGGNGFSPAAGNCGGGGGGGGGLILVLSSSASGGAISGQTLDVSGGTGGTGIGTGTNGGNGSSGTKIILQF